MCIDNNTLLRIEIYVFKMQHYIEEMGKCEDTEGVVGNYDSEYILARAAIIIIIRRKSSFENSQGTADLCIAIDDYAIETNNSLE